MTLDQLKRRLAAIPAANTVGPLRLMEVDEAGAIERRRNSQTPKSQPNIISSLASFPKRDRTYDASPD